MMRSGDYVGCYRVVGLIAQGGMGVVYEAINDQIGRRVAIKQLHPWLAPDAVQNLRFLNEARVVNLVRHPGLVTIHDYGLLPGGNAYIVMEYLEGQTLTERLRARRGSGLSVSQTVRLARQAAAALTATHDKGVVHCDLKPDNLMIIADPEVPGGERIKILDFGIASGANARQLPASAAKAGIAMGTPGYIAPEQIYDTGSVDGRADVYSLGVILYEMLSGKRPFSCRSDQQELVRHVTRTPPPILQLAPTTPVALAELVHSMLAKQPADRPSMQAVTEQLHAVEEYSSPSLLAVGQTMPRRTSLRTLGGACSAVILLLTVLGYWQLPLGSSSLFPTTPAGPRMDVEYRAAAAPEPLPPAAELPDLGAVRSGPADSPPSVAAAELLTASGRPRALLGGRAHDWYRNRKTGPGRPGLSAHPSRRNPRPNPPGWTGSETGLE